MAKGSWILSGLFLALAALFRFALVGYGTMALLMLGLGVLTVFYSLTRRRWKSLRRIVSALLLLGIGCFLAAEIPVLAGARSDEAPDSDWLVVMGAGIRGTEPSLSMLNRLEPALEYLQTHPGATAIVSGSQGADELVSEASVMKAWLVARGIAPERILLEEQADSTYENIQYSLAIIARQGGDPTGPVTFVSSDYHLCRIRLLAEAQGCRPRCIAGKTSYPILMLNYAIREAFALWELWVFGPGP